MNIEVTTKRLQALFQETNKCTKGNWIVPEANEIAKILQDNFSGGSERKVSAQRNIFDEIAAPAQSSQPKSESWQEIAREARRRVLNALNVPVDKDLGYDPLNAAERVDVIILAAIERSHAAQPQRSDQAEQLARTFHNIYEKLAPDFGYETRTDTRDFKPDTPNGKLMIAVCAEILNYHLRRSDQPPSSAKATDDKHDEWTPLVIAQWLSKDKPKLVAEIQRLKADLFAEREKATRLGIELLSTETALNDEHTNAEAWRLTCKGKEGAYVKMEQELAAERQRREQAETERERWQLACNSKASHDRIAAIEQQLLSALAAIARHNSATRPDCPWGIIEGDLSALHQHDAEVHKPLVAALEIAKSYITQAGVRQFIDDTLEKAKAKP